MRLNDKLFFLILAFKLNLQEKLCINIIDNNNIYRKKVEK